MRKSILCNNEIPTCYFCGTVNQIERHHCLYGIYREKADKYGLWVYLCYFHHRGQFGVHSHKGRERSLELQSLAQIKFEEKYGHDKFISEFKRNFLGGN